MNERRIARLLERELDGELSPLEHEELRRILDTSPETRGRERVWADVVAAIGSSPPSAPSLLRPRVERAVVERLRASSVSARIGAGRSSWFRWALGGVAVAAVWTVLVPLVRGPAPWASAPDEDRLSDAANPKSAGARFADRSFEPAAEVPVSIEVRVTSSARDPDSAPTTVTF